MLHIKKMRQKIMFGIAIAMMALIVITSASAAEISKQELRQKLKLALIEYFKNPEQAPLTPAETKELLNFYVQLPENKIVDSSTKQYQRTAQIISKLDSMPEKQERCIDVYDPVCGTVEPKMRKTFSNSCYAEKAGAVDITNGACKAYCSDEPFNPGCACKENEEKTQTEEYECPPCPEKKNCPLAPCVRKVKYICKPSDNSVCIAVYDPVCGVDGRTYGNRCELEKAGIEFKHSGECSSTKVFCTEDQRNARVCTREFVPVCGFFDPTKVACKKSPCAQAYSNKCGACSDENVQYWIEGECEDSDGNTVCTQIYDPVCAWKDNQRKDYGNECIAKTDGASSPVKGKCPQTVCKDSGGLWRQFNNGCVDSCSNVDGSMLCTQAFTFGCDCGSDKCWNGDSCVANPS